MVNSKLEQIDKEIEDARRQSELRWFKIGRTAQIAALPLFVVMVAGTTYWGYKSGYIFLAVFTALLGIYILIRVLPTFKMEPKEYVALMKPEPIKSQVIGIVVFIIGYIVFSFLVSWWYG